MKRFCILCLVLVSGQLLAQRVGINTPSPLEPLDVNGNANFRNLIKLNGSAGTAGQVITSSGAGADPTWMSTAYTGGGRFYASIATNSRSTNATTGRGTVWNLTTDTEQSDSLDFISAVVTGTDIEMHTAGFQNNYIEVATAGLYHFEGLIRYFVTSDLTVLMLPRCNLLGSITQAGLGTQNLYFEEVKMDQTAGSQTAAGTNQYNYAVKFSVNLPLRAGATLGFITGFGLLRFPGGTDLIAIGISTGGYISGHLIAE